jgi:hypothetical protein
MNIISGVLIEIAQNDFSICQKRQKDFGQKMLIIMGHPPKKIKVEKENTHHPILNYVNILAMKIGYRLYGCFCLTLYSTGITSRCQASNTSTHMF